jgi:3-deoxy-D-manno-octulosonic-acid transferase
MRFGVLYKFYQSVLLLMLPVVFVALLVTKRGRRRFLERFGVWRRIPSKIDWWIHAASLGEARGVSSFIKKIREEFPEDIILLTGTSPSGLEALEDQVDFTRLLPIDCGPLICSALGSVSVRRLVITETEIWPSLLHHVFARNIPVHIINGRVSDYTVLFYQMIRWIVAPLLVRVSSICVPDEVQRKRYLSLIGAETKGGPEIVVTGHTKYDIRFKDADTSLTRDELFPEISDDERVFTLGCLRSGEEDLWFSSIARLWAEGKKLRVVVVPRHAERFEYFWKKISSLTERACKFSDRLSDKKSTDRECDILLVDKLGVLREMYSISDGAFVGATLVDIGGHNPFEAAMFGIPVVVGPYISVIAELISDMRKKNGIVEVQTSEDIERFLRSFIDGDPQLKAVGLAGGQVCERYRGATSRALKILCAEDGGNDLCV